MPTFKEMARSYGVADEGVFALCEEAAACARREIRREFREIARAIFQPGMHRTHDDAVRQTREAQIERGEQARVWQRRRAERDRRR